MMNLIGVVASVLLGTVPWPALADPSMVDLDAPGVLEALARSKPVHYDKIQKIVADVGSKSDREVDQWLRASFDAHDVRYAALLMVSHPPKRRLSFTLDEQGYTTIITLDVQPRFIPAR